MIKLTSDIAMENAKDGFNLQSSLLVAMLGITTPHLKQQAEKLLRDALSMNPTSPVSDSSFLGRMKKLLFKPIPRKLKSKPACLSAMSSSSSLDTPVMPPIARGDIACGPSTSPTHSIDVPVAPTIARGTSLAQYKPTKLFPWEVDVESLSSRRYDEDAYDDPSIAESDYEQDLLLSLPPGQYNSRGQRLDEDGDIVRDERVYICEEAIYSYSNGTPFITDTYDLYALVKECPLDDVLRVANKILANGIFTPKDLHCDVNSQALTVPPDLPSELDIGVTADEGQTQIKAGDTSPPSTCASTSQTRNLIAHYIRTIALPPLPEVDFLTKRQRRKLLNDRGKQEKARLRQLKTFIAALKA